MLSLANRVMDRDAQSKRRKETIDKMPNEAANTAAGIAERGAQGALEAATPKKGASRRKSAQKRAQTAKRAKTAKARKELKAPPDGSKKAKVLALLGRKEGATLAQMMKATGWQAHSVRGFLSGSLGKKLGLKVESAKSGDADRVYRLGK